MRNQGECETEYRRNYRNSKFRCFTRTYQSNLDFRIDQRGRFQRHIREPFEWDEEEWYDTDSDFDEDAVDDQTCYNRLYSVTPRQSGLPLHKYKHEKLNKMYRNRMERELDSSSRHLDAGDRRRNENKRDGATDGDDSALEGSDDSVVHVINDKGSEKRRSPVRVEDKRAGIHLHYEDEDGKYRRKSYRRHSSPSRIKGRRVMTDPGPFIPYGHDNNVQEVGGKKTHNVRASKEIHPSALRAQQRLRTEHEQSSHRRQCLRNRDALTGSAPDIYDYEDGAGGSASGRRSNTDGIIGANGMTVDPHGNTVPWQRGGSHAPYIPDGTGTTQWVTEYDREYQPRQRLSRSSGTEKAGAYTGPDQGHYGLSYGRRLRDEGILPST